MDFQTAKQQDEAYIIHSYSRFPVLLTKGKGAAVQDDTRFAAEHDRRSGKPYQCDPYF